MQTRFMPRRTIRAGHPSSQRLHRRKTLMTPPSDPLKSRPPKPVAWALLISVLLNLFLVGVFLGVVPHAKHKSFAPLALASAHGEYLAGWVTRYLDPKDADTF